jgi:hypothetical protein
VVVDFSKRSDPDFTKKQSTSKVTFRHQVIDYIAYCAKFGYCISPIVLSSSLSRRRIREAAA